MTFGDLGSLGPGGPAYSPFKKSGQTGSSFLSLSSWAPPRKLVPLAPGEGSQTIGAYVREMAGGLGQKSYEDAYAVASSLSGQIASALSSVPQLMVEDAKGQRSSASNYLEPGEIRLLGQLPEFYRNRLLNVDSTQPAQRVRKQMETQLRDIISKMTQSGHVNFDANGGREWELESLLALANAVNRLPLAQRKQLDGVTFLRTPKPEAPKGAKLGMLDQLALDTIAGRYDINTKTVSLYDRGVRDGLPDLNPSLRQSLRVIQRHGYSEDIRQLQKMLNPYLVRINQPIIGEDGNWGTGTAKAIRMVQVDLISRQLQEQYPLNSAQKAELADLKVLAASPQFDLITRMTDIQTKMQNLNLLPDPHLKQLLQEFARSEFGEASLKFLMQDISNDFRSTPSVSRVEEIMTHEMGHHFQLGQSNESHYVSEFGKLSHWKENDTGEVADGYIGGSYTAEDLGDVYHVLACDCKQDKGYYKPELSPQEHSQKFVSNYAATDPMEDFAESYKDFVLNPTKLLKMAPEKFFFLNALPAIQARKTGAGAKEASHYQPQEIEAMVEKVLSERFPNQRQANGRMPFDSVKAFIRQQFEIMMDVNSTSRKMGLNQDVVLAISETHRKLLDDADMLYIPTAHIRQVSDADEAVFGKLHEQTQRMLVSRGQDTQAQEFFQRFAKPQEIDKLFPKASPELRQKLKDPSFASMMLALGKIGGHAFYINQLQNKDQQQMEQYQQAKGFFNRILDQPSSLLSNKTFSYSWNYVRGLSSEVFNPEEGKISQALDFFQELEKNQQKALPDIWKQLPEDFQDLLRNRRFIMAVSGDYGRYLPSTESTRQVLEEVMDMLEFQRGIPGT